MAYGDKRPSEMSLNIDILSVIADIAVADCDVRLLYAMSATCRYMNSFIRNRFAFRYARSGDDIVEFGYVEELGMYDNYTSFAPSFAEENGSMRALEYVSTKTYVSMYASRYAAMNGHTHILRWLLGKNLIHQTAVDLAAGNGHIEAYEYLRDNKYDCSSEAVNIAAANGFTDIIKILGIDHPDAMCSASEQGHFDTVKYLNDHKFSTSNALDRAAERGHFEIVKYLTDVGAHASNAINLAAGRGHFEIVKYLETSVHGYVMDRGDGLIGYARTTGATAHTLDAACASGNLHMVEWLIDRGVMLSDTNMRIAARHGHVDIVKLLSTYHIIDDTAIRNAAKYGHINVLQQIARTGSSLRRAHSIIKRTASIYEQNAVLEWLSGV